tara:strand:- start:961 stop:1242 length:282 start_codon:yes stop_codon:yes gene_type:complete
MVRRQIRRNKQVVADPTKEEEDRELPMYEKIKNAVLKTVDASGDAGCTARELQGSLGNIDPRRIREATSALTGQSILKRVTCRCGSTPIYTRI